MFGRKKNQHVPSPPSPLFIEVKSQHARAIHVQVATDDVPGQAKGAVLCGYSSPVPMNNLIAVTVDSIRQYPHYCQVCKDRFLQIA